MIRIFPYLIKHIFCSIQHLTERASSPKYSFYQDIQSSNEPLKVKVRKATKFVNTLDSNVISLYPMQSNPRGLVLLITNIHYIWSESRHSAQHDKKNLEELFEQMGFKVISEENLTGKVSIKYSKTFIFTVSFKRVRKFKLINFQCFIFLYLIFLFNIY